MDNKNIGKILLCALCCAAANPSYATIFDVTTFNEFAQAWETPNAPDNLVQIILLNSITDPHSNNTLSFNKFLNTIVQGNTGSEILTLNGGKMIWAASNFNSFSPINGTILNMTIAGATGGAVEMNGDGDGSHTFTIGSATTTTNFTGNTWAGGTGGAAYLHAQAQGAGQPYSWTVTNTGFTSNSADNGGALYNMTSNSSAGINLGFAVTDSTFTGNSATNGNGGAMYNYFNNGAPNVTFNTSGNTFSGNTATGQGGAIYNLASNPYGGSGTFNMTNSTFTGNSAASGGAVYSDGEGGGASLSFIMDGSTFTNNSATGNGGAVVETLGITGNAPYTGTTLFSLQNVTFTDNTSGAFGGAIYKYTNVGGTQLSTEISGTFSGNSATSGGGAMYNSTSNYSGTGIASIVQMGDGTTFTNNTTAGKGGAIYNDNQGYINMNSGATGITFSGNTASSNSNGNDIYMANTKATVNFNVNGAGNIDIGGGIAGIGGTITMQGVAPGTGGVLNLDGFNDSYVGTFTQNSGQTEVGGSFFGGASTLDSGLLEFNNGSSFARTGTLTLAGGQTNINNSGSMTLGDGSSTGTQLKGTAPLNKTLAGTGNLFLVGDESGYSGLYTQDAGQTAVLASGTMFSGQNNIDATNASSTLSVLSGQNNIYYNANLINGATLNHFSTNSGVTTIAPAANPMPNSTVSAKGVNFVGSGNSANFGSAIGSGGTTMPVSYALSAKLDNGLANAVNFSNSIVTFTSAATTSGLPWYAGTNFFDGSLSAAPSVNTTIDYTGATTYGFTNSVLDLANSSTNFQNYYFTNLTSDTTDFMTLKVAPDNNTVPVSASNPLIADTLSVANAGTSLIGVDRILIFDSAASALAGRVQILYGDPLQFDANVISEVFSATTSNAYFISAVDANGTTTGDIQWLQFTQVNVPPGTIILNDVNMNDSLVNAPGARSFQIGSNGYTNTVNLGVMNIDSTGANAGSTNFSVFGQSTNAAQNVLDAAGTSLFNITPASNGSGAASFSLSDLTVTNAVTAGSGSVLNMSDTTGTAVVNNVIVQGNTSAVDGGAIDQTAGTVAVANSQFSSNIATTGSGGAIDQTGGTMSVMGTSFTGNSAAAGFGGAIATDTAVMNISGGTFTGNDAANGGAIYNSSSDLTVSGGTSFTNNSATTDGGAIYNASTLTLDTSTGSINFSGNSAGSAGADIYNNNGNITLSGTAGAVNIGDGIAGTGSITNNGSMLNLAAGSDSTGYTGTYTQTAGTANMIGSSFGGDMAIDGGTLNWGNTTPHLPARSLQVADGATLNILSGGFLQMNSPADIISAAATVNINQGGTLEIQNDNNITLNSADSWAGSVILDGPATLTLNSMTNAQITGTYTQTDGNLVIDNGSNLFLAGPSSITGGNITISNSTVHLTQGIALNLDSNGGNLNLNNATVDTSSFNNAITNYTFAGALTGTGINNFMINVNGANQTSNSFTFAGPISGDFNIANFNFLKSPISANFKIPVFISPDESGAIFTSTAPPVRTALGTYIMSALGNGYYGFSLESINDQMFRGQVATLAMYNSQLAVNNMLFDHVYLDSNQLIAGDMRNRYAVGNEIFAPYQFTRNEGGLWFKSYVNIEKLSMTHDLNIDNNIYGTIVGADFNAINLKRGWKFLPTVFIAYNGGHQTFDNVGMFQNGGQAGFMGTFWRHDFIGSVLAYGGGYNNEMNVAGFTDHTGNWFAGTASKAAYNFHPSRNFIIQPNLLASYNIFGNQNWHSDFGPLSMNSGFLNGINVAPGLNLIYGRESWSVYLTTLYMYNINDQINGRAGEVDLPSISMRHGWIEYGVGIVKTFKERLMSYAQVSIRNGGRTGVALQFGLLWKF